MHDPGRTKAVLARRGQKMKPVKTHKKLEMTDRSMLELTSKNRAVIWRKVKTLFDLAGTSRLTREEASRLLDELRSKE